MALIELIDISKSYDGELVLDEFNLKIKENEFITLLGPSGCGKTTTLRILGGFTTPDTGKVLFQGEDITNLAANKRQINTVFQRYALFPHMNIAENIACHDDIKLLWIVYKLHCSVVDIKVFERNLRISFCHACNGLSPKS